MVFPHWMIGPVDSGSVASTVGIVADRASDPTHLRKLGTGAASMQVGLAIMTGESCEGTIVHSALVVGVKREMAIDPLTGVVSKRVECVRSGPTKVAPASSAPTRTREEVES